MNATQTNSTRGLGIHSFGIKPSLDSYIAGLNRADVLAAEKAADLLDAGSSLAGSFDPEVSGTYSSHSYRAGNRCFADYHVSVLTSAAGLSHELRHHSKPHFVYLGDDQRHTVGYAHQRRDGRWSARTYDRREMHLSSIDVVLGTLDEALRYLVLSHLQSSKLPC